MTLLADMTPADYTALIDAATKFVIQTGVLIGLIVNAWLTIKGNISAAKAAQQSTINSAKADVTAAKLDVVHAQINGELAARAALIEKTSFIAGAQSEKDRVAQPAHPDRS